MIRELPSSTACYDCYRAALYGVSKADIQSADREARDQTEAELVRLGVKTT